MGEHDEIRAQIRARGLRATGARVAVLELLRAADGPLSHGDVAEALAATGYDRATLFRNLNDLSAAGLLVRFDAGDRVWRFEPAPPHGHAHFVCTDCGSVQCLDNVDVRIDGDRAPEAVQVQLRGVCESCV